MAIGAPMTLLAPAQADPLRGVRSAEIGSPNVEGTASYVIAVSSFKAALRNRQRLTGKIGFDDGDFPVWITLYCSNADYPCIELVHQTRDDRASTQMIRDRVRLAWTEPTYGGRRWWFVCPQTGRRTTKLFLPNGGWHFWSRQAYRLGYACQREDRFSRLQRRAAKLNRELGGDGWDSWHDPPPKPKWMRWRTYEKKYQRWVRVAGQADVAFMICAARLLSRRR